MKRVLVTGPVERIAEWCEAVRDTGWEPVEFPLIAIAQRDVDPLDLFEAHTSFHWICVTSASAIPFLERARGAIPALEQASIAVVGEHSADRLLQLGLPPTLEPASNAHELFVAVSGRVTPRTRILWPRGDRSDELARELRAHGCEVVDPIVYETRTLGDRAVPECEAVFFASPSAVAAWHEGEHLESEPKLAIAIGETTLDALFAETGSRFERALALASPTPEAFAHALAHLDPA